MSDQNDNKPVVIKPPQDQSADPTNRNFQRPIDASPVKEDINNNAGPDGSINLNRSDAEEVTPSGIAPNKGEQDGGAGS